MPVDEKSRERQRQRSAFLKEHSEYSGHTGVLLATVGACPLFTGQLSFQSAHEHLLGCPRCTRHFAQFPVILRTGGLHKKTSTQN